MLIGSFGSIVKPKVLSFVCVQLYSNMTKNNDTAWPKVKSSSVEMGPNNVYIKGNNSLNSAINESKHFFDNVYIVYLSKYVDLSRVSVKIFITHAEKAIFVKFT